MIGGYAYLDSAISGDIILNVSNIESPDPQIFDYDGAYDIISRAVSTGKPLYLKMETVSNFYLFAVDTSYVKAVPGDKTTFTIYLPKFNASISVDSVNPNKYKITIGG